VSEKVHVVVVIVNYRTPRLTIECVESVLGSSGVAPQVVVVDNASGDDSTAQLQRRFGDNPSVTIVARSVNDGYTGGNNAGVAIARDISAPWALLLNSDTTIAADCLRLLVDEAERDPRTTLVNPRIVDGDAPDRLWFGGSRYSPWRGRPVHVAEPSMSTTPHDLEFATGCAVLVRLDALRGESPFDPSLFAYAEDLDLSRRVRARGERIRYVPQAVVRHFEGSSHRGSAGQSLRFYLATRNSLRVAARHARWFHWPILAPMLAVDAVGRFAAVALRNGDWRAFVAVLRGALHAFTGGRHPVEHREMTS
jgi:GT2 family glycosyltransferase